MKIFLLFISVFSLTLVYQAQAATCNSTSNGTWSTASRWSCGSVPNITSGTPDNVSISHALTSATGLTFDNGQSTQITGSLIITGNLVLNRNSVLTVNGGNLEVTGTLEVAEGAKLVLNGGTVLIKGNTFTNGANGGYIDIKSGTMTVEGTTRVITVNSSIVNKGTFKSGDLTMDGNTTSFTNSGTVLITGTTNVITNSTFTNTGTFRTTLDLIVVQDGKMNTTSPGTVTVDRNMAVYNSGVYTMNSGTTQIVGNLDVSNGGNYTMTIGTTNVGGNMTMIYGGKFSMDGTTTIAKAFSNTEGAVATIGANDPASTIYTNQSNTATNGISNNSTINGKGWLSWKGSFVNYVNYGGFVDTVPGPDVYGPSIPSTNPFSLSGLVGSLPVRIVSFQASKQAEQTVLHWTTTHEVNFAYFQIERSFDAQHFQAIAQRSGQGQATNHYQYLDAKTSQSTCYYRLKAVDQDGSAEYSKIISVQPHASLSVEMYPNPVSQQALQVNIGEQASAQLELVDKMGRLVWQQSLQEGLNQVSLPTELKADVYYALVRTQTGLHRTRLVVQ